MKNSKVLPFIFLAVFAGQAMALDKPVSSAFDPRIRSTVFNPEDVVDIDAVIGVTTHIELEAGEQYVTHAFGDSQAWEFANAGNHIFIKAVDIDADTNLIIVTNRRTYKFRLNYKSDRNASAIYSLTFIYPDTARKVAQEQVRKQDVVEGFKQPPRAKYNINYDKAGDLDVAPIHVWDNNEFTYFEFAGNVDLPGIYLVDAAGNESMANRNTIGDSSHVYSVQKVNPKWRLRLGDRVATIFNNAFDPIGVQNKSRTQSPGVKRVVLVGDGK